MERIFSITGRTGFNILKPNEDKCRSILMFLLYLLSFIFYLCLACNIPYTHDDWDWGRDIGLRHLLSADINSRYTGNAVVVLMTRSVVFKNILMASISTSIPLLLTVLSGCRGTAKALVFMLSNLLLLNIDSDIWRQTYAWVSGYANFVVSGCGMLLYFYIVEKTFSGKINASPLACILLFIFAFFQQMFIENLSFLLFAAGIAALIVSIYI